VLGDLFISSETEAGTTVCPVIDETAKFAMLDVPANAL
jgi:hypothetical protein